MKKFVIVLLSVFFVALVTSSIQYASADHSLGDQGIFKDKNAVNTTSTKDSKYLIHLQLIVRNAQGQLASVSEVTHGSYIPHKITDAIFDTLMDEKEVITIDKMRYQKTQYIQTETYCQTLTDNLADRWCRMGMQSYWDIKYCAKFNGHGNELGKSCIPIFQTVTPHVSLGEDDVFTLHWTILREL